MSEKRVLFWGRFDHGYSKNRVNAAAFREALRQRPVGRRLPVGDRPQKGPDLLLEMGSLQPQGRGKARVPAAEIEVQPADGIGKDRERAGRAFRLRRFHKA